MPAPVYLVTHEFYPKRGGIGVYVEELARAMPGLGLETQVWAPVHEKLLLRKLPYPVQPLPIHGNMNWPDRLQTMRALLSRKADLADACLCLPEPGALLAGMYLNALGKLPGKRLVLVLHGSEMLRFAKTPHRRWLFGRLLKQADAVGVVSKATGALLEKHFPGCVEKRVEVPGALRHDFDPNTAKPQDSTHQQTLTLLTVARIHPRKGQHVVLEALARLPEATQKHLRYRIAGPVVKEPYAAQLRALALKTATQVEFLGEVSDDDLPKHYHEADIFVMTSIPRKNSVEGFGLVYLEAGACGLPVIAHDTGGVGEAVRDEDTGYVLPIGETGKLAESLQKLADNPDLRQKMGAAARQRVRELSWEENARRLFL